MKKKKLKISGIFRIVFSIITVLITVLLVLNILKLNVVPDKYLIIFVLAEVILNLLIIILFLFGKKKVSFIIGIILFSLLSAFNIVLNTYVKTTDKFIEKGFNNDSITVSTEYVLLTRISNSVNDADSLTPDTNIYSHRFSKNIDLAEKKLGNYKYIKTDSVSTVLYEMNTNPNTYLLISKGNYDYLFSSAIEFNKDNYKIIKDFEVKTKEKKNTKVKSSYTIYLNGLDFTGIMRDFNMLITVNTKKKKIVMTPVLRGYYVDVPGYNTKDTLMCLGSFDSNVSREALEKLFNTKIDYTVNVNTNSLVKVVDSLGGIEFCSDYSFKTTHALVVNSYDDSKGKKLTVEKGCRNYNGIEILTISRERLNLKNNERGRIENCRKILDSIVKKTLSTSTLTNYSKVLNSYSDLYTTDMNRKVISNLFKSLIEDYSGYEIVTQSPDGTDGKAMGHLGTQEVGVTFPNMDEVNAASKVINDTLKD